MTSLRINLFIETVYDSILLTHWQRIYFQHQSSNSIFNKTISTKKSSSSKASDEDERINCRNNFFAQCCNTAANKWRKERKEKEYDKCWWKIDEDEYEKTRKKEIEEEERELLIYNVRRSRREEFKCTNFNETLH